MFCVCVCVSLQSFNGKITLHNLKKKSPNKTVAAV